MKTSSQRDREAVEELRRSLLTVPEVAAIIGVSEKRVRSLIKQGDLPAFKLGREYRIKNGELDSWIEAHRIGREEVSVTNNG